MTPKESILDAAKSLGLSLVSEFVPFSRSRNNGEKHPSLNWRVTIMHRETPVLTTDYSAGMAHAPSYKQGERSVIHDEVIRWECQHGYRGRWVDAVNDVWRNGTDPLQPDFADVLHSLVTDAEVIDCATFEDWAANYGFDPDSRKAEAIYRQCLDLALKLRNAVGEDGMAKLRTACQDY